MTSQNTISKLLLIWNDLNSVQYVWHQKVEWVYVSGQPLGTSLSCVSRRFPWCMCLWGCEPIRHKSNLVFPTMAMLIIIITIIIKIIIIIINPNCIHKTNWWYHK